MHGYTLSQFMNPLISVLHVALAHLQCDVHFEYVPSTANPADLPSSEPSFLSSDIEQVLAHFKLLGPSSQSTTRIPSIEGLDGHKNILKTVAQSAAATTEGSGRREGQHHSRQQQK